MASCQSPVCLSLDNMASGLVHQFVACFCVTLSVFICGTALGWPSPVLYSIEKTGKPMNLSHSEAGLMVSMLYVGNMISPLPSGVLMDRIGPKTSLHVLSVVPLASWFMVYFAKAPFLLHVARLLAGSWFGTVISVVPTYVGEVSQPEVRGALSTLFHTMASIGVLFSFVVGPLLDFYVFNFILATFPVIFIIILFFLPESPYWLAKRGRHVLAAKSLSWLRNKPTEEVKQELSEIEDTITKDSRRSKSIRELVATKGNRRSLLTVEVLALLQRGSGISVLLAFVAASLPEDGPMSPNDCVIVTGVISFLSIFLATFLVDRLGRRPLLLFSSCGCAINMFIIGLWFFLDAKTNFPAREYTWVPFTALSGYSFFFSIGLGPVHTTIQGEVFASNIKGYANGITAIILSFASFGSNIIYYEVADRFGIYANYIIFTMSSVLAALFVQFYVIETKGKTLSQIQKQLNEKKVKILSEF